jgi:hypothetical protein
MKRGRNKYQREARGELMLIHECVECKVLSINRIAADDDPKMVMSVFQESLKLDRQVQVIYQQYGILILNANDTKSIRTQLYGRSVEMPAISWA